MEGGRAEIRSVVIITSEVYCSLNNNYYSSYLVLIINNKPSVKIEAQLHMQSTLIQPLLCSPYSSCLIPSAQDLRAKNL